VSNEALRYVPKSELDRLSLGSYEYLSEQVNESIRNARDKLFPKAASLKVVCTFPARAVVETNEGFFSVDLVRDGDRLIAARASTLVVESYDDGSMVDFLRKEADCIVESFEGGDKATAAMRIKKLIQVAKAQTPISEGEISALAISKFQGDRPWKRVLAEKEARIRQIAGSTPESTLSPKFERIIQGRVPVSSLDEYTSLVHQSLVEVDERITKARESAKASEKKLQSSAIPGLVENISHFAEDLRLDLVDAGTALSSVNSRVHDLRFLAEVHDVVVLELAKYELAARFLEKSATISEPLGSD